MQLSLSLFLFLTLSLSLSRSLFLSLTLSLSLSRSLFLSLTGEQGAHNLFTGQRGTEKEGGRESEKEEGRESEKEGGRESEKEEERELLFLFLKGIPGALAPFTYLVFYSTDPRPLSQISDSAKSPAAYKHSSLIFIFASDEE
jgi:hypothetical protein